MFCVDFTEEKCIQLRCLNIEQIREYVTDQGALLILVTGYDFILGL